MSINSMTNVSKVTKNMLQAAGFKFDEFAVTDRHLNCAFLASRLPVEKCGVEPQSQHVGKPSCSTRGGISDEN
jgi:hypothetical protein